MNKESRFMGSLMGLAVGDSVGVSVEFQSPGTFEPVKDMTGGGVFRLKSGQWTDDTSMALCLAESLLRCKGFNLEDQIQLYNRWFTEGYLSSTGDCFDIGNTVRTALERYRVTGEPYSGLSDTMSAGNGSLMRLSPVPLLWANDLRQAIHLSGESSRTTHQEPRAVDACRFFGALLVGAVNGLPKEELLSKEYYKRVSNLMDPKLCEDIAIVGHGSYKERLPPEIRGSGYVVQSMEAALWAFYHGQDFEEGLLLAVNLGDDADTTGAIFGQLAGAYYGISSIPQKWTDKIEMQEFILSCAKGLYDLHLEFAPVEK